MQHQIGVPEADAKPITHIDQLVIVQTAISEPAKPSTVPSVASAGQLVEQDTPPRLSKVVMRDTPKFGAQALFGKLD